MAVDSYSVKCLFLCIKPLASFCDLTTEVLSDMVTKANEQPADTIPS